MLQFDPAITELVKRLNSTANAYRASILLLTANRFSLFQLVSEKPLSAEELAARMKWDARATGVFLNALTALGFLKKEEGRYSNTDISEALLVPGKPYYQGDILNHNLNLWERWSRVAETLKTGQPPQGREPRRTGDDLRAFIFGMANLARLSATLLWQKVDLSAHRRLLDVGGGPGSYAHIACQLQPQLQALVFDLPEVESLFNEEREKYGVGQRVRFHAGDFNEDLLPEDFDLVLLSNIIHSLGAEENRRLISRIYQVLAPGGLLLVKDFYLSEDGTQPVFSALFAVNMLLGTDSGACYSRGECERWLKEVGFTVTEFFDLNEQTSVQTAQKT